MNILVVASFANSLINFRGPLLKKLTELGHNVHAIAPDVSSETARALEQIGVLVHEIPMQRTGKNPFRDLSYFRALKSQMKELHPDLVLTYTIKPNIWGAFAARWLGIRSIAMVTGLGYAFTQIASQSLSNKITRFVATALYRLATNCNAMIIFQNPDDRDDFIATGCLANTEKVGMINGSGVDLCHYTPASLPDTPDFLMISRMLGAKGVREYAQAAIQVKQTHPHARFRLVGFFDEGLDSISRDEVDGWIAKGFEYFGPSDDVRPHLAACRAYVLPSYREGTPRSVLEAMATGRPILTSDAPGCRETVTDGVNGFLVPVGDIDSLVDKMLWMIENPEGCERMAEESLRLVREKYDVNKVNDVLISYLGLDK